MGAVCCVEEILSRKFFDSKPRYTIPLI